MILPYQVYTCVIGRLYKELFESFSSSHHVYVKYIALNEKFSCEYFSLKI